VIGGNLSFLFLLVKFGTNASSISWERAFRFTHGATMALLISGLMKTTKMKVLMEGKFPPRNNFNKKNESIRLVEG